MRQALADAVPPPRKVYPVRPRPAIDGWATVIDAWLIADKDAPRKQRHTARRIWQRLVAEHQATLSEVTVSRYVARRRVELGLLTREVSIPQTHLAGAEAEVDFGEFYATIAGLVVKCWMFVMRLSHSGKAFHVAFATQAQEAFLEGHVLAFEYFGGVPGRIRYDNLKPAVIRVLKGRDRTESERFTALRSHYGFDSFFCRPGIDGAHEKGGVEGEIGRFRRRHLVPVPTVASLAELNELIAIADLLDDDRVITGRPITIGRAFAAGGHSVDAIAGRGVRLRAAAPRAGRQPGQSVCAAMLLLRPGPLRRATPTRALGRPDRRGLRRTPAGGPARTGGRTLRGGPVPGSLPRGPQDQTRRPTRRDRTGTSQDPRRVHRLASGLLGCRPARPRRHQGNPRPDRNPAGAPHHGSCRAHRRDGPGRRLGMPGSRDGAHRRPPRHHRRSRPWPRSAHWPATTDHHRL